MRGGGRPAGAPPDRPEGTLPATTHPQVTVPPAREARPGDTSRRPASSQISFRHNLNIACKFPVDSR
jgi:hypothetical protein